MSLILIKPFGRYPAGAMKMRNPHIVPAFKASYSFIEGTKGGNRAFEYKLGFS